MAPAAAISLDEARQGLEDWFAPWVRDLGMQIENLERGRVTVRVPASAHLNRVGGILSGQAMMAIADTAMVFAVRSCAQPDTDIATVQQSTSFFRGVRDADLICEVSVRKEGRTMMFGDCVMHADGQPEKPVAQATLVYAVIPRR